MARKGLGNPRVAEALQAALDHEMAGVFLYTELAFRVFGPQMLGIVAHLEKQAEESLVHARAVGNRMTAMGFVPAPEPPALPRAAPRGLEEILTYSLGHERAAVDKYRALLALAGDDVPLEEFARSMVAAESDHVAELEKLLRPMG